MTEDDPERLARIAHEADAAWYEGGYPDTWPYENRKPWEALDDGARAWCVAIADAVAAEVRRQDRAKVAAHLDRVLEATEDPYVDLDRVEAHIRAALAALEDEP